MLSFKKHFKKKRGKKKDQDHLQIQGEFDQLFEGIDMKDGDESSAVPIWHTQCIPPKRFLAKRQKPCQIYEIDYVYGGKMNDVG